MKKCYVEKLKKSIMDSEGIPQKRKSVILREFEYRIPMLPVEYLVEDKKYIYYYCPRCDGIIEKEYVSYCCVCGQALTWRGIGKAINRPKTNMLRIYNFLQTANNCTVTFDDGENGKQIQNSKVILFSECMYILIGRIDSYYEQIIRNPRITIMAFKMAFKDTAVLEMRCSLSINYNNWMKSEMFDKYIDPENGEYESKTQLYCMQNIYAALNNPDGTKEILKVY